jgi:hypothetical protein
MSEKYPGELAELRAAIGAVLRELGAMESANLPAVTEKQARRVVAHVAGESATAIAKAEGVSRQAVTKSLGTSNVHELLRGYAKHVRVTARRGDEVEETLAVERLVTEISQMALSAKRPIVLSFSNGDQSWQKIEYVDNPRTRLDTSLRLLSLISDAQAEAAPAAAQQRSVEDVLHVETTRTRARRVRRSPAWWVAGGCAFTRTRTRTNINRAFQ